jgi:hypothetical protein
MAPEYRTARRSVCPPVPCGPPRNAAPSGNQPARPQIEEGSMRKTILGALALGAVVAAHSAQAADIGGFVGMAITGGGKTLAHVTYSNGDTQDIKSGGLVDFKVGFEYRQEPASPFALQGSVGYHVDRTAARNGNVKFQRYPLELLGFYSFNPHFRLGGGLRYAADATLTSSGVASDLGNSDLSASVGGVIEGEYLFTPHFGLTLRAVSEEYKFKGTNVKVSGDHLGVRFNYYFP